MKTLFSTVGADGLMILVVVGANALHCKGGVALDSSLVAERWDGWQMEFEERNRGVAKLLARTYSSFLYSNTQFKQAEEV